jgi:DNA-binding response OmpR family regulator
MKRILVIEDDNVLRETIIEILSNENYKVSGAQNGEEGINIQNIEKFDLIITDILMPNKDGLEVIMNVRKNFPQTKIIAISGGGRVLAKDYLSIAEKFGSNEIIEKPFDISELLNKVSKLIN